MMEKIKIFLLLIFSTQLSGQSLSLDTTFGNQGIVTTAFSEGSSQIYAMGLQTDGKVIVSAHRANGPNHEVAILRYTDQGTLDQTFGNQGVVILTHQMMPSDQSYLKIIKDDKILVVSTSRANLASYDNFLVAQFLPDGTPDPSFGENGIVSLAQTGFATGLEIQSDNKILIVGDFYSTGQSDFGIVRLTTSGSPDPSFGVDGRVSINFGNDTDPVYGSQDNAQSCLALPNGKILVGGNTDGTETPYDGRFGLVKLNEDGSIDTNFGTNGKVTTGFQGGTPMLEAVLTNANGEIFALGPVWSSLGGTGEGLVKYDALGNLDTSIGNDGYVLTQFNTTRKVGFLLCAEMAANGKIIGAGFTQLEEQDQTSTIISQYNADGTPDQNFGTDGFQAFNLSATFENMFAILLLPNNQILTGGLFGANIALARFNYNPLSKANPDTVSTFAVYPNPADTVLNLKMTRGQSIDFINITDVSGKKVLDISGPASQVDLSKLACGIYFIEVGSQGKTTTQKFIKK